MNDLEKMIGEFRAKKLEVERLQAQAQEAANKAREAKIKFDEANGKLNSLRHDIIEATKSI